MEEEKTGNSIKKKIEELKIEYRKELENNSIKAFILKCKLEVLQEFLVKEDKHE